MLQVFFYLILALYYASPLEGAELRPQLDQLSIKLARFSCNREPQTPDLACTEYKGRVAVEFDLRALHYLTWKNQVHGEGTKAKFETMGWHYELGLDLDWLQIFWEHHSRHTMDKEQAYYWDIKQETWKQFKYPVEDSYGVRIIFYQRK
jgi:hypothetical protein